MDKHTAERNRQSAAAARFDAHSTTSQSVVIQCCRYCISLIARYSLLAAIPKAVIMSMIYEIHLYVPKLSRLTPSMLDWLFQYGQSQDQPEIHWPVRRLKTKALARALLKLDPMLIPVQGPGDDIELHYP